MKKISKRQIEIRKLGHVAPMFDEDRIEAEKIVEGSKKYLTEPQFVTLVSALRDMNVAMNKMIAAIDSIASTI